MGVDGPSFTIITPALNAERWIAVAIGSVVGQTRRDWEMVVVDNGSTDATVARVTPFLADPRVRLVRSPENRSPAVWRNEIAAGARGRYLVMLDADDWLLPRFLAEVGAVLDARPEVAVVSPDALLVGGPEGRPLPGSLMSSPWWRRPADLSQERMLESLLQRVFLYAGSAVRREDFLALGGLDPDLFGCMDWDLWIKIAAAGREIVVLDEPLAVYRVHSGSLSRPGHDAASARFLENVELMFDRILAGDRLTASQRKAASSARATIRRHGLMARSRDALVARDHAAARHLSRAALSTRPGARTAAIVAAIHVAPGAVRALHVARLERAAHTGRTLGFRSESRVRRAARLLRRGS